MTSTLKGNILVVGGAGYIGSHMVKCLNEKGYRAVVLDNLSTGYRDLIQSPDFFEGDIRDRETLDQVFGAFKFNAVMHFAASSLVGESVENPAQYYRNNVMATFTLLNAMIEHGVKRFIFSSTAAVYGEPQYVPINETHVCAPTNPYGNTKLTVERMLSDFAMAYDFKYASLRYFNAAGADPSARIGEMHENETHLIPIVLGAALDATKTVKIFGTDYPTPDGSCLRDYIHVNDLASAHLLALNWISDGHDSVTYNLGNNMGYSVKQVLETAQRITGRTVHAIAQERRSGDPAQLIADSSKIRKELGWQPQFEDLELIIETAWKWHKKKEQKG